MYCDFIQRDGYRGPGATKLLSMEMLCYILLDITMASISEQYLFQVNILVGYVTL
jgi:hypothetical protein